MKLVSRCFLEQCEYTLDQTRSARNVLSSSIPRLSGTRNVHVWRSWYISSCDHYVTKIELEFLEQKSNVLRIIQPALRSTLGVYDIRAPIVIYM